MQAVGRPGMSGLSRSSWRGPGVGWQGRRERASRGCLPRPRTLPGGVQGPPVRANISGRSTRLWSTTQPSANRTEQAGRGLLDRRLVFLLGKGGVGRSTLAAAFGLLAARQGRRAIVVEVSGRGDVPRLFGQRAASGVESELAPGVWTLDVDPRQALEEYLHDQLPLRMLADLIGSSTTFGIVAAATPGLREMLTIGKIWELAQT